MLNVQNVQTGSARPAMPAVLRVSLTAAAAVCAVVVVALAALYAGSVTASDPDRWVRSTIMTVLPLDTGTALWIDIVGDPRVVGVLALLLAAGSLWLGHRRLAVVAVIGPVLTGIVTTALKPVSGRTIHGEFLAYPSGHTGAVVALALIAALLVVDLTRARTLSAVGVVVVAAGAVGAIMAWAQIVLDAHYPTDTLGGFCAAVATVTVTAVAVDRLAAARSATR